MWREYKIRHYSSVFVAGVEKSGKRFISAEYQAVFHGSFS